MRTVIFDLDGTLADTSGDLLAAANACFIGLGHGPQLGPDDAGTALRGGRAMLRLGFSRLGGATEAQIDAQYPVLLRAYAENIDTHTTLYPGAVDAVKPLRGNGIKVGICTNKPEGLAETLMRNLGVRDLFASLIGADTLSVRKPDPAPFHEAVARAGGDSRRALLVGDSDTDHKTARAANVPSVLVTFGPAGGDMAALQPDALLPHFADLPDLADQLLR